MAESADLTTLLERLLDHAPKPQSFSSMMGATTSPVMDKLRLPVLEAALRRQKQDL